MSLKLLHTGDWHLGKKLFKKSRIQEQERFLDWIISYCSNHDVDALLMCGDLFDSPRPSDEALKLYFDFLGRFAEETKAHFALISGNHDSGRFLEAPTSLLEQKRFHLAGQLKHDQPLPSFSLTKETGHEAMITMFPYFRSIDLELWAKHHLGELQEPSSLNILEHLMGHELKRAESMTSVLMAHHLFGSFMPGGSEQGLYLSGLETIPLGLLKNKFDYVALGHIHRPQTIQKASPRVHYAGAPLPFRFSEAGQKEVSLISVTGPKEIEHERIPLPQWRVLKTIKSHQDNLIEKIDLAIEDIEGQELEEFWEIRCQISRPTSGLVDLAREQLKDHPVELLNFQTTLEEIEVQEEVEAPRKDLKTEALFKIFYENKFPDNPEIPDELFEEFKKILEKARRLHENPPS